MGRFRIGTAGRPSEQAEYLELAFSLHPMDDLVGGEILDPNDQVLAQRTEFLRQLAKCLRCNGLELVERRLRSETPTGQSGKWSGGHVLSLTDNPGYISASPFNGKLIGGRRRRTRSAAQFPFRHGEDRVPLQRPGRWPMRRREFHRGAGRRTNAALATSPRELVLRAWSLATRVRRTGTNGPDNHMERARI